MNSEHHGVTPPPEVAAVAQKGLDLAAKFHRGVKTAALRRAQGLAERRPVSWRELAAISDFFVRHSADGCAAPPGGGDDENPSAAYIAWLLWGGDSGKAWVGAIMARAARTAAGGGPKAAPRGG